MWPAATGGNGLEKGTNYVEVDWIEILFNFIKQLNKIVNKTYRSTHFTRPTATVCICSKQASQPKTVQEPTLGLDKPTSECRWFVRVVFVLARRFRLT
jgi:hypothetical protein